MENQRAATQLRAAASCSSSFSRLASLRLSLGPPANSTVPGATGGPGVEFMARKARKVDWVDRSRQGQGENTAHCCTLSCGKVMWISSFLTDMFAWRFIGSDQWLLIRFDWIAMSSSNVGDQRTKFVIRAKQTKLLLIVEGNVDGQVQDVCLNCLNLMFLSSLLLLI